MLQRLAAPLLLLTLSLAMSGQSPNGAAVNPPWDAPQVLQTDDLAKMIASKSGKPRVFQVGFAVLYKSKHIPGSTYAGPGSKDEGLQLLQEAVASVAKDQLIVLYCGCCPWDHCPNMKPAFRLLQSLGYKNIKVVEIPQNFAKDWVEKGYPVAGDTASK
jgi:thiosulfate/3-mercaptopyruvate sulfurtransferase